METSTACIYWAYSNTTLSILQSDHQILWYRSNCMVWYTVRNVYKRSPCRLSISSSEVVGDLKGERLDGLIEALQKIRVGVAEQPIGRGCVREAGCWSEMLWGHVLRLWFKRLQQGGSRLGYSVFFCVWFFFFYPPCTECSRDGRWDSWMLLLHNVGSQGHFQCPRGLYLQTDVQLQLLTDTLGNWTPSGSSGSMSVLSRWSHRQSRWLTNRKGSRQRA